MSNQQDKNKQTNKKGLFDTSALNVQSWNLKSAHDFYKPAVLLFEQQLQLLQTQTYTLIRFRISRQQFEEEHYLTSVHRGPHTSPRHHPHLPPGPEETWRQKHKTVAADSFCLVGSLRCSDWVRMSHRCPFMTRVTWRETTNHELL